MSKRFSALTVACLIVFALMRAQAQPLPSPRSADSRPKQVEAPANVRCVKDSFGNLSCNDGSRVIRDSFGNVTVIPGRR